MPIAALSENTARAICSSLVLNDAISVIKELIDNALDSHATNIIIEISANTLDVIQIKDNGTGIGVEDRQLLCKRGFTSKIRSFEDLAQLGGTSLGFRGEALACIAELSDSIAFTTRVDGETVGTQLKFDSQGKLSSSSSAPHGTGTTVRISDFLKKIPVRRQTAQKQAVKTLPRIKKLLFDYAFARPTVRFSCKVLKSKSELRDNWTFAPCKDARNLQVLASKIVGKDVAAQCKQESIKSEDDEYIIDTLMVMPGADLNKSGGSNRFFSIDGRPLTAERGMMKDLHKIYRSYLQNHLTGNQHQARSQFLLLRLQCPNEAYDVNVEPSKDEVMFGDSHRVLKLFEDLCIRVYGEQSVVQTAQQLRESDGRAAATPTFDILLAKRRPVAEQQRISAMSRSPPTSGETNTPEHSSKCMGSKALANTLEHKDGMAKACANMCGLDDDYRSEMIDACSGSCSDREQAEAPEDVMNAHVTNPFVLAKMSTRLPPQNLTAPSKDSLLRNANQTGPEARPLPAMLQRRPSLLPSPTTSPERDQPYQNPGPPNRPWGRRREQEDEESLDLSQVIITPRPTLLDTWAQSVSYSSAPQNPSGLVEVKPSEPIRNLGNSFDGPIQPTARKSAAHMNSKSSRQIQQARFRTPLKKSGPSIPSGHQQQFPSPERTPRSSSQQVGSPRVGTSRRTVPDSPGPGRPGRPGIDSSTELDDIMDFEHRKRNTILQRQGKQIKRQIPAFDKDQEPPEDNRPFSVPSKPYNEGVALHIADENAKYASRFATNMSEADTDDDPLQPKSASATQNPHQNRYKKAIRDLEKRSRDETGSEDTHTDVEEVRTATAQRSSLERSKLSPNDPRAYLIRHQDDQEAHNKSVKQKRTRSTKYPFEMIVAGAATFNLTAMLDPSVTFDVASFRAAAGNLHPLEPYIRSGPADLDETRLMGDNNLSSGVKLRIRTLLEERTLVSRLSSPNDTIASHDANDGATR